jgi:hypothetical protein
MQGFSSKSRLLSRQSRAAIARSCKSGQGCRRSIAQHRFVVCASPCTTDGGVPLSAGPLRRLPGPTLARIPCPQPVVEQAPHVKPEVSDAELKGAVGWASRSSCALTQPESKASSALRQIAPSGDAVPVGSGRPARCDVSIGCCGSFGLDLRDWKSPNPQFSRKPTE